MTMFSKTQGGFTLIELMISISLGLLITASVVELFVNNKTSYRVQDGLGRIQENGRYAQYILSREIRMAGFNGCGNLASITPTIIVKNPTPNMIFSPDDVITGHEATSGSNWLPNLTASLNGNVLGSTDAITIRKVAQDTLKLNNNMVVPNAPIVVPNRLTIAANDIVMVIIAHSIESTLNQR